ncbi:MAG: hypothetical protein LBP31_02315 [Holosporales bacterium]|jgi:hypothetical protein|nr:hypothetical protein [Holosporales bacterium]
MNSKKFLKNLPVVVSIFLITETCRLSAEQESQPKGVSQGKGPSAVTKHMKSESEKSAMNSVDSTVVDDSPYTKNIDEMLNVAVKKVGGSINEEIKNLVKTHLVLAVEKGVELERLEEPVEKMCMQAMDFYKNSDWNELKNEKGQYDNDEVCENLPAFREVKRLIREVNKKTESQSESGETIKQEKSTKEEEPVKKKEKGFLESIFG